MGCMQLLLRSEDMNEASRLVKYACGSTNLVPRHFGPNRAARRTSGIKSITCQMVSKHVVEHNLPTYYAHPTITAPRSLWKCHSTG